MLATARKQNQGFDIIRVKSNLRGHRAGADYSRAVGANI